MKRLRRKLQYRKHSKRSFQVRFIYYLKIILSITYQLERLIALEVYFDQTLLKFRLHNQDSAEVDVRFSYLHPTNAGIRYFYPGWEDPKTDPTKAGLIPSIHGQTFNEFSKFPTILACSNNFKKLLQ